MGNLLKGFSEVISGQMGELRKHLDQVRTLLGFGPEK